MEENRRQQESERKRSCVVDAAIALFAEHGYKKTSAQAVADKAGVSKGLVFLFFDNKLGLYEAVVAQLMEQLAQHTDKAVAKVAGDHVAELQAYIKASLDFILGEPLLIAILRQDERLLVTEAMDKAENYGADNITGLLQRGIKAGVFRDDLPARAITQVILDLMLGMMERACRGENRLANSKGVNTAARFVQAALVAQA